MLQKYYSSLDEKPGDIRVDLHMHSNVSDGTWNPDELVDQVKKAGIRIFALTDHDDTANVAETALYAADAGICHIPGVEISSTWNGHTYHILGFGIDIDNLRLNSLLEENRAQMDEKDDESIRSLEKLYPQISFDEYRLYVNKRERGGWKSLNYLIDKGLCTSYKDYAKAFTGDFGFSIMKFRSPAEVIRIIAQAGGNAVLAHPGASFYDPDYRSVISHMLQEGIHGIECYHPENSEEITQYSSDFCRRNNLMITGGSDCHGTFLPSRRLGVPGVRLTDLIL